MIRYWIGVASLEHVLRGVAGGFAQVCHEKPGPLKSMKGDDWIIYYSPTVQFGGKKPCQSFTAVGKISPEDPYTFAMSNDFIPWRRNVSFLPSKQTPIQPLLEGLTFIKDKKKWGFPFRRGCFEILEEDFLLIARHMGVI
jgi:hypothetical protein